MKCKFIIGMAALTLGMGSVVYAAGDYFPPERINCTMADGKLTCQEFNRQYLIENTTTADWGDKDQTFTFYSGNAFFAPSMDKITVFYTYKNSNNKNVTLKTFNTTIRPDLANGNWIKLEDDLYTCNTGYMHCPITNLPSRS